MNIKPLATPTAPTPVSAPGSTTSQAKDARAKAVAAFMGSKAPEANPQPVPNATQVAPEELGALRVSATEPEEKDKEETAVEAQEVTPEPSTKVDPLSSQYATLARKEKALRSQIQQFKAEQAEFQKQRDTHKAPELDLSKYIERDRLKSDPLSVLTDAGLSYDEITEAVLSRGNIQTDPRINQEIAALKADIKAARDEAKAIKDSQDNNQKQSYQQALNQLRQEAGKLAFTDPAFEMIKETNSVSDVVELIESTFKADGILLSVEEACQAVEDHLLEEAIKLSKVKKLQQRLGQSTAPKPAVNDPKQPQPTTNKTLTNGMSAQRPMSARERAIAAMEGKLKG